MLMGLMEPIRSIGLHDVCGQAGRREKGHLYILQRYQIIAFTCLSEEMENAAETRRKFLDTETLEDRLSFVRHCLFRNPATFKMSCRVVGATNACKKFALQGTFHFGKTQSVFN